jgi:uncharacterized Rmd1/YagE family protein
MPTAVVTERTPLLLPSASSSEAKPKTGRNVTFNPNPIVNTIDSMSSPSPRPAAEALSQGSSSAPTGQPMLSTLNNKLRPRNNHGTALPFPTIPASKIGPQRTTKNTQKLKLLPNPDFGDEGPDEESGREVYSQYTRIKDPTARRDAARLGKADRDRLPRVTAYCTANKYHMDGLMRFLKSRGKAKGASPKLFDECIYTPYSYSRSQNAQSARVLEVQSSPLQMRERRHSDSAIEIDGTAHYRREALIDLTTEGGDTALSNREIEANMPSEAIERRIEEENRATEDTVDFDTRVHTPEIFLFNYGVVVIWGMSLAHEHRFLKEIAKFESEKLAHEDVETECFNFYYTREYQERIYNDFITLREKNSYMTKLAISHALAQSVKVRPLILKLCGPHD